MVSVKCRYSYRVENNTQLYKQLSERQDTFYTFPTIHGVRVGAYVLSRFNSNLLRGRTVLQHVAVWKKGVLAKQVLKHQRTGSRFQYLYIVCKTELVIADDQPTQLKRWSNRNNNKFIIKENNEFTNKPEGLYTPTSLE